MTTTSRTRAHDRPRSEREDEVDQVAAPVRHGVLHRVRVRRARHARDSRIERAAGIHLARRARPSCSSFPTCCSWPRSVDVHRGGRAVRVDEARLGPAGRRDRRGALLGHEPAVGRRVARVHLDGCMASEGLRDRHGTSGTMSSSSSSSGSRSASRSSRCAGKMDPELRRVPALLHARLLLAHGLVYGDRARLPRLLGAAPRRRVRSSSRSSRCCSSTTSASSSRTAPRRRWRTRAATCRSRVPERRPRCAQYIDPDLGILLVLPPAR